MSPETAERLLREAFPEAEVQLRDHGQRIGIRWPGESRIDWPKSLLHVSESDLQRWINKLRANRPSGRRTRDMGELLQLGSRVRYDGAEWEVRGVNENSEGQRYILGRIGDHADSKSVPVGDVDPLPMPPT